MTAPLWEPARAYWAIIRLRALILPLLKSETGLPVASTAAVIASADSLIFTTRLTSGWMKARAF